MRFIKTVSVALVCLSTAAFAQESGAGSNGYAGLRGSLAFEGQISGHESTTPPTTIKANTDVGGGASAYWGWHLPYGFDTELELLYRYQSLSDASINGVSGKIGGYTQTLAPIVNAYWHLPVGDIGVRPFIGGGVGYGWNETGLNSIGGVSFTAVHEDKWKLVYNAMAGISIPAGPRSRITGMYRWLHQDVGVSCGTGLSCSAGFNTSSIDIGIEFDL
jgi:opacity protein-like surface antigen